MLFPIPTFTEENYLKAVYHLSVNQDGQVTTNALADHMQTKPPTVNDMLKKLAAKKYISYQKYKGASLTRSGEKIALTVIRKHRLWEVFLFEKLDFNWDEVHEVAEQLEHIRSPLLIEKLEEFLGHPKVDPHGDPIPDQDGKINVKPQTSLSELETNIPAVVSGVTHTTVPLLRHLDHMNIRLGLMIEIVDRVEFDGSIQVQRRGLSEIVFLSKQVADHIMVREL